MSKSSERYARIAESKDPPPEIVGSGSCDVGTQGQQDNGIWAKPPDPSSPPKSPRVPPSSLEAAALTPSRPLASVAGHGFAVIPMILVFFAVIFLRWYDSHFSIGGRVNLQPTDEQLIPPVPKFCDGLRPGMEKQIFYFDLGGTYCACEKQWNRSEYWKKTFSGLAFNLPHFIDALVASIIIGDIPTIVISVFANEFVEECVVAFSYHWGFTGDPYLDMEPRYDTMLRDVVHCMIGVWLALSIMRPCCIDPWVDVSGMGRRPALFLGSPDADASEPVGLIPWHPRHFWLIFHWEGTAYCTDKTSPVLFWRLALMGITWWQLLTLYNLDRGIHALSLNNVCVTCGILLWWAAAFSLNLYHQPHVPRRRLITQHAVLAIITSLSAASCIWTPLPTIYLIMVLEGTWKLCLTLFDIALEMLPALRKACQLDVENDDFDTKEWMAKARISCNGLQVPLGDFLNLPPAAESGAASAFDPGVRIDEDRRIQTLVCQLRQNNLRENRPISSPRGRQRTIFNLVISLFLIAFGLNTPLMYDQTTSLTGESIKVQYARHWCGNPHGPENHKNTCFGH